MERKRNGRFGAAGRIGGIMRVGVEEGQSHEELIGVAFCFWIHVKRGVGGIANHLKMGDTTGLRCHEFGRHF